MISSEAARAALALFEEPTARDKQRRVGPSEIGDLCQRCLADKLLGIFKDGRKGTPLAPLIGTAFHEYAETLELDKQFDLWDKNHDPMWKYFHPGEDIERYPGLVLVETKVTVGEAGDYGVIKGTMDRFDVDHKHGIDWKILTKKKAKALMGSYRIASDGSLLADLDSQYYSTLLKYYNQLQLYGKGMEDDGFEVENLSLIIIPRDVSIETLQQATVELEFPYRRNVAEMVLTRAGSIYDWARNNLGNLDDLDSDPGCYYCSRIRSTDVGGLF